MVEGPALETEKIVTTKMDTLARLGCFKPIYLLRDLISRGELERAKNLFGSVVEDLRDSRKISQRSRRRHQNIGIYLG